MSTSAVVTVEECGAVAVITLDRPPANAYDLEVQTALAQVFARLDADPSVRVVILRSASRRFFCAGADIKTFAAATVEQRAAIAEAARATCARIERADAIVIAEIGGHTLGGGLELAMACDIRIGATGEHLFGMTEISLGLIPGNGGTQRLARIVGQARAMELLVTGRTFQAEQARAWGLLTELCEPSNLRATVNAMAETIARQAPLALGATKRALRLGAGLPLAEALEVERAESSPLLSTDDAREGLAAYLERRDARFVGR